jgi:hypothetical protein
MALSPASSRAAASGAGFTPISVTTLGADGTIDVQSIPQTFNDLVLVLVVRGTRASTAEFLQLQLNGDAGANYDSSVVNGNTAPSTSLAAASLQVSTSMPAATATAGLFGGFELTIFGYTSTGWDKTVMGVSANPTVAGATITIEQASGVWRSTSAVNRVTLFGGTTAALKAGSVLRIYGR